MESSPHGSRQNNTLRSPNAACWTCRLRRKKCDGSRPVCNVCAALLITCHYSQHRPEWMDGGTKQEERARLLKREVRAQAHRRRREPVIHSSGHRPDYQPLSEPSTRETDRGGPEACMTAISLPRRTAATSSAVREDPRRGVTFGHSDAILSTFHLHHVLPFLFPFYQPSPLRGGTAWVLEMMVNSPVVRQATLCQTSYFFSLAQNPSYHDSAWVMVLTQINEAFDVLRRALQFIQDAAIKDHLHGAVRILTSIMQLQRFEIAVSSFDNCKAHLSAAVALFKQLLNSSGAEEPDAAFKSTTALLAPMSGAQPVRDVQIPSPEQAALGFSSALLMLDDIIASTMLQEEPKLYEYCRFLLGGADPLVDLEGVVGCQNWVLLQISEIARLDAWKQQCQRAGSPASPQLDARATVVKEFLYKELTRLDSHPSHIPREGRSGFLSVTAAEQLVIPSGMISQVTRVWAHAALLYLFVVTSRWQSACKDVPYHVGRTIELMRDHISPPAILRTLAWPFCVAGCLADPGQEVEFRRLVESLQPSAVFGTMRKALEIMELVWRDRHLRDTVGCDLATYFRSDEGHLMLLV